MDAFLTHVAKFLSNTVTVQIYSFPNFSIEVLLAGVVCVVHSLLIIEVNSLFTRTNARIATKLRLKHPIKEVESSYHSLAHLQSAPSKKVVESNFPTKPYSMSYKRLSKKLSTTSNFGWVVPQAGDAMIRTSIPYKDHYDRVEHLLSITPSEYIRRDKERKSKELGLRTCIQSLTSLLEKALNNEMSLENLSRDAIKRSINTIRENFENQICDDRYLTNDFPTASLQSLIAQTADRNILRYSLSPTVLTGVHLTYSSIENKLKEEQQANLDCKGLDDLNVGDTSTIKEVSEIFTDGKVDEEDDMTVDRINMMEGCCM